MDEVAEQVAEWETNPPSEFIAEEKFEQIEAKLHHNDLPKAAEAKFIEYDSEDEEVKVIGEPTEFKAIISVAESIERPARNP